MKDIEPLIDKAQAVELPQFKLLYAEQIINTTIVHYAVDVGWIESYYSHLAEEIIETMEVPTEIIKEYEDLNDLISKGIHFRGIVEALPDSDFKEEQLKEINKILNQSDEIVAQAIQFYKNNIGEK